MSERRYKGAAILLLAALAFGAGKCSANQDSDDASPTPRVIPGPTKTVTETKQVTRESIPAPCREAMRLARKIDSTVNPLIAVGNKSLDIMADAHEAITTGDGSKLNELRSKMYQLTGKTSQPTVSLKVDIMPEFVKQMRACQRTAAYQSQ